MMKSRVIFDLHTNFATSVALSPCGGYIAYLNYKHKIVNIVDVAISQITHQIKLSDLPAPGNNKTLFWIGRYVVVIIHTGQGFAIYDSQDGYQLVADVHIGTGKLIEDVAVNAERERILLTTFLVTGSSTGKLTELFEYSLPSGELVSSYSESGINFHTCDYAQNGILALANIGDGKKEQKWRLFRLSDELVIDDSQTKMLDINFEQMISRKQCLRCIDNHGTEKFVMVLDYHKQDGDNGFGYFVSDSNVDDGKPELTVWNNGFEKLIKVKERFYALESIDKTGNTFGLTDVECEDDGNPDFNKYVYKSNSVVFDLDTNGSDVVLCGNKITLLKDVVSK